MRIKYWIKEKTDKFCQSSCGEDISFKETMGYSIAGFGQNLIYGLVASFLMVFMTDALGFGNTTDLFGNALPEGGDNFWLQASTAVAFLMLGCRVFDALNDPIMGSIVDRTRTKWGKCRPYLKWSPLPIVILTILCFLPWYPNNVAGFASLSVIYVLWSLAYTTIDVPYWGLTSAMSADTDYRSRLLTVARLIGTAGFGLISVAIPPIAQAVLASSGTEGLRMFYFIATIVLTVMSLPMFYYGFKTTKERYISNKPAPTLRHNMKLLFQNKPLMLIALSGVLGCAKTIYTGAGGLYFAKYVLYEYGGEKLFSIITMLIIPGGLIASLLCPLLQKKFSKKWTYIVVHLLGGVIMLVMYFIGYDAEWKLIVDAIGLVLLGFPQGIYNIMSYAMIGDSVDYLEWKTGERAEGICFSVQTYINKIVAAAVAFIGVMAFSIAGFKENVFTPDSVTVEGSNRLWAILILSGAISMFLTTIPMFFYKFTEKEQKKAIAEICERKKSALENN